MIPEEGVSLEDFDTIANAIGRDTDTQAGDLREVDKAFNEESRVAAIELIRSKLTTYLEEGEQGIIDPKKEAKARRIIVTLGIVEDCGFRFADGHAPTAAQADDFDIEGFLPKVAGAQETPIVIQRRPGARFLRGFSPSKTRIIIKNGSGLPGGIKKFLGGAPEYQGLNETEIVDQLGATLKDINRVMQKDATKANHGR